MVFFLIFYSYTKEIVIGTGKLLELVYMYDKHISASNIHRKNNLVIISVNLNHKNVKNVQRSLTNVRYRFCAYGYFERRLQSI